MKSCLRVPPAAPLILYWTGCSAVVFGINMTLFGRFRVYASKRDLEDFKVVNFCVLRGCVRQQFRIVLNSGHTDG